MSKVKGRAWYVRGQMFLEYEGKRIVADVSMGDLMNIRAGYAADVEVEERQAPEAAAVSGGGAA